MRVQHFFFCATKPILDAGIAPSFVLLNNTSLFLLNKFLYNCTLLNLDLTPGKVGATLHSACDLLTSILSLVSLKYFL